MVGKDSFVSVDSMGLSEIRFLNIYAIIHRLPMLRKNHLFLALSLFWASLIPAQITSQAVNTADQMNYIFILTDDQ